MRALLARELLLVFPGQNLSEDDHKNVSRFFGQLGHSYGNGTGFYYVTDKGFVDSPDEQESIKASTGDLAWHQDHSFLDAPNQIQSLFSIASDPGCAPTEFASHIWAAEHLDAGLRTELAGKRAHHEMVRESAEHPVFDVHKPSGQTLLYVNGMHTKFIVDCPADKSDAYLSRLYAHIYAPENVYRHEWRTGDLVIWDNIALSHRRPPITAGVTRTLRGTEIGDSRSVACVAKFGRWFYTRAASTRLKRDSTSMRVLAE